MIPENERLSKTLNIPVENETVTATTWAAEDLPLDVGPFRWDVDISEGGKRTWV